MNLRLRNITEKKERIQKIKGCLSSEEEASFYRTLGHFFYFRFNLFWNPSYYSRTEEFWIPGYCLWYCFWIPSAFTVDFCIVVGYLLSGYFFCWIFGFLQNKSSRCPVLFWLGQDWMGKSNSSIWSSDIQWCSCWVSGWVGKSNSSIWSSDWNVYKYIFCHAHIYTYLVIHIHIHIFSYTYIHIFSYTHTHTHTHTHTQPKKCNVSYENFVNVPRRASFFFF